LGRKRESLAGDLGLYIKNKITVSVTDQFNLGIKDCEDMWIEFEMKQIISLVSFTDILNPKLNLFKIILVSAYIN